MTYIITKVQEDENGDIIAIAPTWETYDNIDRAIAQARMLNGLRLTVEITNNIFYQAMTRDEIAVTEVKETTTA